MPVNFTKIDTLIAALPQDIDDGLKQGAEYIGDLAQQLAPEDSGDLKASKSVDPGEKGYVVSFGEGLPDIRAVVQEFGSVNQDAQPYLTPAKEAIDVAAEVAKRIKARVG
jgi:hypothetical protein